MEIMEIISYSVNVKKNILEVSFRTIDDNDEVMREERMDYSLAEKYGYELEEENYDMFFDVDEDGEYEEDLDIEETILDEEQLMSFLNEYYTVNPQLLPKPDIY